MLHTLKLCSAVCQLYLNKTSKKKGGREKFIIWYLHFLKMKTHHTSQGHEETSRWSKTEDRVLLMLPGKCQGKFLDHKGFSQLSLMQPSGDLGQEKHWLDICETAIKRLVCERPACRQVVIIFGNQLAQGSFSLSLQAPKYKSINMQNIRNDG